MHPNNYIVLTFWISDLNIIELINTPEYIKDNKATIAKAVNQFFKGKPHIILILLKLTVNELAICPLHNIQLLRISTFYIKLKFSQLTILCMSIKLYYPPFIVKEITSGVYVALFKVYVECGHCFAV